VDREQDYGTAQTPQAQLIHVFVGDFFTTFACSRLVMTGGPCGSIAFGPESSSLVTAPLRGVALVRRFALLTTDRERDGAQTRVGNVAVAARAATVASFAETFDCELDTVQGRRLDLEQPDIEIARVGVVRFSYRQRVGPAVADPRDAGLQRVDELAPARFEHVATRIAMAMRSIGRRH
jgi:hypothetical protein